MSERNPLMNTPLLPLTGNGLGSPRASGDRIGSPRTEQTRSGRRLSTRSPYGPPCPRCAAAGRKSPAAPTEAFLRQAYSPSIPPAIPRDRTVGFRDPAESVTARPPPDLRRRHLRSGHGGLDQVARVGRVTGTGLSPSCPGNRSTALPASPGPPGFRCGYIVAVDRRTGELNYSGSANDEG
jgi:hypothetical protein